MSDDFSGVTSTWNKTSYNSGDQIIGTISGVDKSTQTSAGTGGPISVPVVADNGVQSMVTFGAFPVTVNVPTTYDVKIDTSRSIVDSGSPPRTWTVSVDRKSISSVA